MTNDEIKEARQVLGDAPIEEKFREQMNALAWTLDDVLNPGFQESGERKTGFCLMMFNLGEGPGRSNYISNCRRDDMIKLMEEQLAKFKAETPQ